MVLSGDSENEGVLVGVCVLHGVDLGHDVFEDEGWFFEDEFDIDVLHFAIGMGTFENCSDLILGHILRQVHNLEILLFNQVHLFKLQFDPLFEIKREFDSVRVAFLAENERGECPLFSEDSENIEVADILEQLHLGLDLVVFEEVEDIGEWLFGECENLLIQDFLDGD